MLPPLVTLTSLLLTFQFTFCMNYGKSLKSTTDNKNSSSISDRALSVFSVVKVEKDSLLQKDWFYYFSFLILLVLLQLLDVMELVIQALNVHLMGKKSEVWFSWYEFLWLLEELPVEVVPHPLEFVAYLRNPVMEDQSHRISLTSPPPPDQWAQLVNSKYAR